MGDAMVTFVLRAPASAGALPTPAGRVPRAGLAALVLAMVLAACSGGGQSAVVERLAQAADRTAEAGTARIGIAQSLVRLGGQAGEVALAGEGVVDLTAKRGRLTLEVAGAGAQAGARGAYELIFDGTTVYAQLPGFDLPTPWLRIELGELPGMDAAQLEQFAQLDPADGLRLLSAAIDEVETVGEEEIRGVTTTHHRLRLDLKRAAENAPPEAQEYLGRQVGRLGVETLPLDVWLDEEGRVRRQAYQIDLAGGGLPPPGVPSAGPAAGAGAPTGVRLAVDYYDFGVQVDVAAPPPDEVTSLAELEAAASPAPS